MSLSDLKKKGSKTKAPKRVDVDAFIADADNYALGKKSEVLANKPKAKTQAAKAKAKTKSNQEQRFRHCTFTLDKAAVDSLAELAAEQDQAKSKLIRIMLEHFDQLSAEQRQAIIEASKAK